MATSKTWPAGHPSTTWPAGHSSTTLSHPRGTHSVDSLNVSHCPTWQYTYSLTCHCIYTAVAASRDTTLTLARANAAALESLPHMAVHLLSHLPLQLHCITAVTASHGSTLTLSRATVSTLQSLTLSHSTVSTLQSLPHVAVHSLSHVLL